MKVDSEAQCSLTPVQEGTLMKKVVGREVNSVVQFFLKQQLLNYDISTVQIKMHVRKENSFSRKRIIH